MAQKQIIGVIAGVVIIALMFLVYRQFSESDGNGTVTRSDTSSSQQSTATADSKKETIGSVMVPVPDTIDGITSSIEAESAADLSVMDAEEGSSLDAVNQDSDSVNNLGTSYDENNL